MSLMEEAVESMGIEIEKAVEIEIGLVPRFGSREFLKK